MKKIKTLIFVFLMLLTHGILHASQPAHVAGSFYPANSGELETQLSRFLPQRLSPAVQTPRILLAPHAGYSYSGATAGLAFHEIQDSGFSVVIVLGVAHQYPVRIEGALLDPAGTFETPLGKIPIEEDTCARLLALSPKIIAAPGAFVGEHSVEVELPFLQKTVPGFHLVPLLMNAPDLENAREVGNAIAQVMRENEKAGKKTLLVLSSDFAHYPSQKDADLSDLTLLKSIEAVDPEGLFQASKAMMKKGIANLATPMCGEAGVLAGLYAARALGISEAKILRHSTSADVPKGESWRVVGYAAAVFYENAVAEAGNGKLPEKTLSEKEKKQLLQTARESVRAVLEPKTVLAEPKTLPPALEVPAAVFVTIRKNGKLRGCVGTTEASLALSRAVAYYAKAAAFEDPRFPPVTSGELKTLSFEISLLSPRSRVPGPDAIEPGRDGVLLIKGDRAGLFLPQVWEETGWDKETFLNELASQKAGLPERAWKDPQTELYTFTVDTFEEK